MLACITHPSCTAGEGVNQLVQPFGRAVWPSFLKYLMSVPFDPTKFFYLESVCKDTLVYVAQRNTYRHMRGRKMGGPQMSLHGEWDRSPIRQTGRVLWSLKTTF